jgi:hypothetical protein
VQLWPPLQRPTLVQLLLQLLPGWRQGMLQLQLPGLQQTNACITGPLPLLLVLQLQFRGPPLLLSSSASSCSITSASLHQPAHL